MLHLSSSSCPVYNCPCDHDPDDDNEICPHLNPRLYIRKPYGTSGFICQDQRHTLVAVLPIDLGDLKRYTNVHINAKNTRRPSSLWKVQWISMMNQSTSHSREKFSVTPGNDDIGRKFTIAIIVAGPKETMQYQYAIKHTDTVNGSASSVDVYSPYRSEGSWNIHEGSFLLGVAIHLHKK